LCGPFGSITEHGDNTEGLRLTRIVNRDNIQTNKKTVSKGTTNKMRNKKKNTYNIATWNVRSMYEGNLDIVREEMNRLNIEILGISEMKWTVKVTSEVKKTK
jgi:hypothetical protein